MEGTVLMPSFDEMKHVRTKEGEMLTKPFIDVCKLILPVLGIVTWQKQITFSHFSNIFQSIFLFHSPRSYNFLVFYHAQI